MRFLAWEGVQGNETFFLTTIAGKRRRFGRHRDSVFNLRKAIRRR
jgi:hypothetical protein